MASRSSQRHGLHSAQTFSSTNFRCDALRNGNDRRPCVSCSYACRGFLFAIGLNLSRAPAGLAATCLPPSLSGCAPHCWTCVHVLLCSGAYPQLRLRACAGACATSRNRRTIRHWEVTARVQKIFLSFFWICLIFYLFADLARACLGSWSVRRGRARSCEYVWIAQSHTARAAPLDPWTGPDLTWLWTLAVVVCEKFVVVLLCSLST